ncbi:MAG: ATP synthase F1 subunit gamma [Thermotogota bacterium]
MGRGQLRAIKGRIESTRSTEHITHAMEMVATAKVNKAVRNWKSFSSYVERVDELVRDCISGLDESHPFLYDSDKSYTKTAVFLITSDMGLAGAYNLDLIRAADEEAKKLGENFGGFMVIGTKGVSNFRYRKKNVLYDEDRFYDKPSFSTAEMLVNRMLDLFEENKADSFKVVYSKFFSSLLQMPKVLDLLPIIPTESKSEGRSYRVEYEFEPEPSKVLDEALPLYLKSHVLNILLEAQVSELYSRQNAMRNATENAENLIERFTLDYNKARQSSITQEIIEIVNGAEALKG